MVTGTACESGSAGKRGPITIRSARAPWARRPTAVPSVTPPERAGVTLRADRDTGGARVGRPRTASARRLAAPFALDPTALDERPGVDRLKINLPGPLTVHRANAPVDVGPPRQRCVLGLL